MKKLLLLSIILLCAIAGYWFSKQREDSSDTKTPPAEVAAEAVPKEAPVTVEEMPPPEAIVIVPEEITTPTIEKVPFEIRAKERFVTLTDTQARKITAEIVKVNEDNLQVVRKTEIRKLTIPFDMLSGNDRAFAEYLRDQQKKAALFDANADVVVHSIQELIPYLDDDNVHVQLAPGTYTITAEDARNGQYPSQTEIKDRVVKAILLFKGNHSTYNFTGVTMNVETEVFHSAMGKYQVFQVHTTGNRNVIKNLTMVDVGSVDDFPMGGCINVVMDGSHNRIEGFHITSTGSKPYGYGDSFGKGGKNNVIGHKKHSTFLIRGLHNHAKDCTLIHRTYGHCMFMQAASYPKIEGCQIEGVMRSTDEMLAERGSGSAADKVDFMTTWGYTLPKGYMMSTGEAGIRAYNAGTTIINGEIFERATDNPTILNCTIKNMRTGVTLAHARGKKYVEGCTAIGCEQAFAIGTGKVVDCYADVAYGPAYKGTYASDNGVEVEITILPSETYYNGSKCVAYLSGKNHKITFHSEDPNIGKDLKILMGGYYDGLRVKPGSNPSQNNHPATNIEFNNGTDYPVILSAQSSNISGRSKGRVSDEGTDNRLR